MPVRPFSSKPYDNLQKVGATAKEIKAHGSAEGWDKLFAIKKLKALQVSYLTQELAVRLGELKKLETLCVFNGLVNDLSALKQLPRLRELKLESLGHIKNFGFLSGLKKLRTLEVVDVTRFKDVSVLANLPLLHTFEISKMCSWVSLPSLASFAKLKQVRVLHVGFNAKDGSLSPLAKLSKLKDLSLPLTYNLEEYARLAVALKNVKCSCFTKPYGISKSPLFKCKRCGGFARITLAKGHRGLCPKCDGDKFQAYLKTFEELKAEFKKKLSK
jgi:hypothetical protein